MLYHAEKLGSSISTVVAIFNYLQLQSFKVATKMKLLYIIFRRSSSAKKYVLTAEIFRIFSNSQTGKILSKGGIMFVRKCSKFYL